MARSAEAFRPPEYDLTRMSRWSKIGVLDWVFEKLPAERIAFGRVVRVAWRQSEGYGRSSIRAGFPGMAGVLHRAFSLPPMPRRGWSWMGQPECGSTRTNYIDGWAIRGSRGI
jgi:hypothetical protein